MQNSQLPQRHLQRGAQSIQQPPRRRSGPFDGPIGWILGFIIVPILLVAVLLLPPVSLLDRLQSFTHVRIGTTGGMVQEPDGTYVNFPAEGITSSFQVAFSSIPREDFSRGNITDDNIYQAAQNLPAALLNPKSPLYKIDLQGDAPNVALLSIPIPNDSLPYETLSLYSWTGERWEFVPSSIFAADDRIEATLNFVPQNFMVMQSNAPVPAVTADLGLESRLPDSAIVTQNFNAGLYLRGDGALEGVMPPPGPTNIPVIRNWEGASWEPKVVRTDLINNLLADPGQQENQFTAIENMLAEQGYPGIVIDYRGVDAVPSARADFVYLVSQLSSRLGATNKTVSVRVEPPTQISAEEWNTGGYDWQALGQVVEKLIVPAPTDPRAYQPNGEMETFLNWATDQVDRAKLQVEMSSHSLERSGPYLLPKGYQEAFQPLLSELQAEGGSPGQELTVSLDNPRILNQVSVDPTTGMYSYSYQDEQNLERTVYIENAASINNKLNLLQKYKVTNVSMMVPPSGDIDPKVWDVFLRFQQGNISQIAPNPLSVSYRLYAGDGNMIAQETRPLENSRVAFASPSEGQNLRVEAQIVGLDGQPMSVLNAIDVVLGAFSPSVEAAAAAPAEEKPIANANPQPQAEAEAPPQREPEPDFNYLVSNQLINIRQGPGINYPTLNQLTPNDKYRISGKNNAGDWWQIDLGNNNFGWVIGSLVDARGALNEVAVATDIPEPPAPPVVEAAPEPVAAEVAQPEEQPAAAAPAPIISAPAPTGGGSFGYGVQAHMVHAGNENRVMQMTSGMGFGWVKQQIEWKVFESNQGQIDYGSADGIVNAANGAGISLLFSIVNAPAWAREPGFDGSVGGPPQDPQTYANFVGAMAGKYCGSSVKAIEVWNEQNLHYEWGNRPLNPGEYVALLAPSYAAIKNACPSMTVVSGALTPAGNNGNLAMDDFTYLEAMFQAGAANYADAIGAHPSGYNVPPSHTWETACEAIQVSGNSFNGACDSPHHSWSFRSTMEGYRNIAVTYGAADKRIWPTEFGWAAGGAFNPNYAYANDNDYGEQAAWTVEAYQMMKSWGWAGPAFLWNLNFRVVADGTEKAQWGILDNGWNPLPAYNSLRDMPK